MCTRVHVHVCMCACVHLLTCERVVGMVVHIEASGEEEPRHCLMLLLTRRHAIHAIRIPQPPEHDAIILNAEGEPAAGAHNT